MALAPRAGAAIWRTLPAALAQLEGASLLREASHAAASTSGSRDPLSGAGGRPHGTARVARGAWAAQQTRGYLPGSPDGARAQTPCA